MRILLIGTRSFGSAVLDAVSAKHDIAAVSAPPGDLTAKNGTRRGLPVHETVRADLVQSLDVDVIVCAHSHLFVGKPTRNAAKLGAIGYHPSLLPRHRGRDAVKWTIKMGDPIAGGSVYWLTDHVDGGPIAAQDFVHVRPGETHTGLWRDALFPMGVRLIERTLEELDAGTVRQVPQDERCATWEPSLESPPLYRPELPELGAMPDGYRVVVTSKS